MLMYISLNNSWSNTKKRYTLELDAEIITLNCPLRILEREALRLYIRFLIYYLKLYLINYWRKCYHRFGKNGSKYLHYERVRAFCMHILL